MTCAAIGLAALLAWSTVLADDVMVAEVTAMTGTIDFVPTRRGRIVSNETAGVSDPVAASGVAAAAAPGADGATKPAEPGAQDDDGPGSADSPAPGVTDITVDGFLFTAGGNLAPGERQTGQITLRNTDSEPVDVRMDVTGSDPSSCFRFAAVPKALDASGTWVPVGDAALRGTPAAGGSAPLGTWLAGEERRFHVELEMTPECTVGSGLSSDGSDDPAKRHPDHAMARLAFSFVTEGLIP